MSSHFPYQHGCDHPFDALESQRESNIGKPGWGDVVEVGEKEYLIQTSGFQNGTQVFVFGEVTDNAEELGGTDVENKVLKELEPSQEVETNIATGLLEHGVHPKSLEFEYGDFSKLSGGYAEVSFGNVNYMNLGDKVDYI